MKEKKNSLKKLFGQYVDNTHKLDLSGAEKGHVTRIVISVSCSEDSSIRFSTELYEHISENFPFNEGILVDSLSPIPVLSAPLENVDKTVFQEVLTKIIGPKQRFRVVCGIGKVEFGKIGRAKIMSYGSSGQIVSAVIEGLVVLPPRYSWGDEGICNLLNIPLTDAREMSGCTFFKL